MLYIALALACESTPDVRELSLTVPQPAHTGAADSGGHEDSGDTAGGETGTQAPASYSHTCDDGSGQSYTAALPIAFDPSDPPQLGLLYTYESDYIEWCDDVGLDCPAYFYSTSYHVGRDGLWVSCAWHEAEGFTGFPVRSVTVWER